MSMKPGAWAAAACLFFLSALAAPCVRAAEGSSGGPDLGYEADDDYFGPAPEYDAAPGFGPLGDPGELAARPAAAVVEGPDAGGAMVAAIDVLNAISVTPDQVRYRMSTRVGHPLDEDTLDGDFQRLTAMGVFEDIQIRKEFVDGGVRIVVAVREKDVIRRIDFRGQRQTRVRKLRSLIESRVGERYDVGKGNRDRLAIQDFLQKEYYYFGEVDVNVEPFEDGVRLVFDVREGGRLYVADIVFRGNSVFTRKELLAKMETKRSGLISRGKFLRRAFERDLERIRMSYLDKGYLDVRVVERPFAITANTPSSRWQRRDAYIHIDIDEGEQYRVGAVNFDFIASSLVPEERIRATIKTMPGAVYSPITLQEDAMKIREVYGSYPNSRYFTRVVPEPEITEDGLVMDVTFSIIESPEVTIEGVRVTGLTHTKEVVVMREFELFPGEKVDSRGFKRSKENIENLGYFKERPTIEIREGSAPDRAVLVAELEEIPTGKITAGVGVSSEDSVVGSVGVSQRNFDYKDFPKSFRDFYTGKSFRGAGQSFSASASAGKYTQNYSVSFANPWIFGRPISMSLGAYFNEYDYDDDYTEQRYGATIAFGKRLFGIRELTVSGGYKFEMVKLNNFYDWHPPEYVRQKGSHNVSRWIAGVNWDTRDSVWEPTRGAMASASVELAGRVAGSSKDFWRAFLGAQYFIPFYVDSQDRNWSLGVRADAAFAQAYGRGDGDFTHVETKYYAENDPDNPNGNGDLPAGIYKTGNVETLDYSKEVPYYERFHLGGVGSLRGFDYRGVSPRYWDHGLGYDTAVGGEAMLSASAEFFFPIWEKMVRGSAFYDVGTVWRYLGDPGYDKPEPGRTGYALDKQDFSSTNLKMEWRHSVGIGLHIKTPLGPQPVRLYYSLPLNKRKGDEVQRFQFSMGALF
ncbi:MAG: outer membrane protein assembly factor BamA [Planctomycetota bacterium]|jgi:outer membrane protein insertion porin family|nr:outer membrane protein assembly factor BamA [Planctomycetota bacterium]